MTEKKELKDQRENVDPRDKPKVDPAPKGEGPKEKPGPAIEIEEGEHHEPGPLMRSATVQTKRKAAREGEIEQPRPPENATAGEAMEYLTKGDTSVLKTMSADAVASVRPMFKQWANSEQDRLKSEYDRVYNAILAEMHDKGVIY